MLPIIVTGLIIALFIADVFFVEFENYGWTTLSMIATGAAIYYFKLWGIPQYVMTHGPLCFGFAGCYIVAGIVWSFIKWFSYLVSYRDQFIEIKNKLISSRNDLIEHQWNWVQDNNIDADGTSNGGKLFNKELLPLEGSILDRYIREMNIDLYLNKTNIDSKFYHNYGAAKNKYSGFYKPEAAYNKSKIIAWICYWPFSLIGTLINDPIRRLVNFLFFSLKATYQRMSDRIFKDFPDKNDF